MGRNWGRTDCNSANHWCDYADIHDIYDVNNVMTSYEDGTVDVNDLGDFCSEWLWDANDPNTW